MNRRASKQRFYKGGEEGFHPLKSLKLASASSAPEKNARPKRAHRGEARRPRQSAGWHLQAEEQGEAQPQSPTRIPGFTVGSMVPSSPLLICPFSNIRFQEGDSTKVQKATTGEPDYSTNRSLKNHL